MSKASDFLRQLSEQGDSRADLSAVTHSLMFAFGGPAGLAREVKLDFDANQPGHANRIKIECELLKLLQNHTDEDEEFEDADLEALAADLESKADGDV